MPIQSRANPITIQHTGGHLANSAPLLLLRERLREEADALRFRFRRSALGRPDDPPEPRVLALLLPPAGRRTVAVAELSIILLGGRR